MEISIDIEGLEELQGAWEQAPQICREELEAAMYEADTLVEREVSEQTPRAHGLLAGSLTSEVQVGEDNVIGMVGTSMSYAAPVEIGTRPHFPPIEPLIDWVRVKLGVSEKEARGVAFLVARKISRVGTQGAHMFERGFAAVEAGIEEIFQRALGRIVARLAGA
jgi:hypothetical protein